MVPKPKFGGVFAKLCKKCSVFALKIRLVHEEEGAREEEFRRNDSLFLSNRKKSPDQGLAQRLLLGGVSGPRRSQPSARVPRSRCSSSAGPGGSGGDVWDPFLGSLTSLGGPFPGRERVSQMDPKWYFWDPVEALCGAYEVEPRPVVTSPEET